jgi:hypothetical protein
MGSVGHAVAVAVGALGQHGAVQAAPAAWPAGPPFGPCITPLSAVSQFCHELLMRASLGGGLEQLPHLAYVYVI